MNFLLSVETLVVIRYVFIAIVIGGLALIFVPHYMKKHKLEKYMAEHADAGKDANLMFHYKDPTCPICNSLYSKSESSHMQQVEYPKLVGGTYFAGSASSVTDTYYSCPKCGYRYYYAGRYVRSTEYYQDAEYKMQRTFMLEGLGQLSEEDRARINKAVEYDQTVRRLREEINGIWS